jgi:hypothetical protein
MRCTKCSLVWYSVLLLSCGVVLCSEVSVILFDVISYRALYLDIIECYVIWLMHYSRMLFILTGSPCNTFTTSHGYFTGCPLLPLSSCQCAQAALVLTVIEVVRTAILSSDIAGVVRVTEEIEEMRMVSAAAAAA